MNDKNDAIRRRYETQLGTEFWPTFDGLNKNWSWGLMRLKEFRVLFSRDDDVALLNAITGGGFTYDVQHILWEDLLLQVCKLTDPKKSAGKDNLSVSRLPSFFEGKNPVLFNKLQYLVETAVEKAEFARDWRNRYISHSDWEKAISQHAKPLAKASIGQVQAVLDAVHAVLNLISTELLEAHIWNDITVPPRARAFLTYTRQLVESVKFIDELVDPSGKARFTDDDIASAFLSKHGLKPTHENIRRIIELRRAARRFT
ncbi:MAG: hypothetical protein OXC84_10275 [Gammaproteobacteria bacterium]|nr:hypothetical protein [Gammaproteobacteria bacterium]